LIPVDTVDTAIDREEMSWIHEYMYISCTGYDALNSSCQAFLVLLVGRCGT